WGVERVGPADAISAPAPVEVGDEGPGGVAARASYAALAEAESQTSLRHEVLLAVTIHARRRARAVKSAGGAEAGACTVLLREVAALRRRLSDASIDVGAVLSPPALAVVVRDAYDVRGVPDPSASAQAGARAMPIRRAHSRRGPSME